MPIRSESSAMERSGRGKRGNLSKTDDEDDDVGLSKVPPRLRATLTCRCSTKLLLMVEMKPIRKLNSHDEVM